MLILYSCYPLPILCSRHYLLSLLLYLPSLALQVSVHVDAHSRLAILSRIVEIFAISDGLVSNVRPVLITATEELMEAVQNDS